MATSKYIDRIIAVTVLFSLILSVVFINAEALGLRSADRAFGYENRLFDTSRVHTLDIVTDEWDELLKNATKETYYNCAVVIDGEACKNVGIRGKGNTSLSSVAQMDSDRYSFKIEFDHYENGKSYHGLDKLCLNNLIQDNTFMKDYLTYRMMNEFGVNAPLCSFVYLTVNGEDWGLYLAVEGVEDSFLARNYGSDAGNLYKPDSQQNGGGKGNGKDFHMSDMMNRMNESTDEGNELMQNPEGSAGGDQMPDAEGGDKTAGGNRPDGARGDRPDGQGRPEDSVSGNGFGIGGPFGQGRPDGSVSGNGMGGSFGQGAMGTDDVKLKYTDDDLQSYSNIFNSAKTDITEADQKRLISSLKKLTAYEQLEEVLDMDQVIRYFTVHNFVVNGDSYTGSMIHNYYLHEKDGVLSMIPWDYNLAFGTFHGFDAKSAVNDPIDTPVSGEDPDDRPMVGWIFSDEVYTEKYHDSMSDFIEQFYESGWLETTITETAQMIAPYVASDPTKFCSYEDFETAVPALLSFCTLRSQSITGQLDGSIPSTSEGQADSSAVLTETGDLDLAQMGDMNQTHGNTDQDFQDGFQQPK